MDRLKSANKNNIFLTMTAMCRYDVIQWFHMKWTTEAMEVIFLSAEGISVVPGRGCSSVNCRTRWHGYMRLLPIAIPSTPSTLRRLMMSRSSFTAVCKFHVRKDCRDERMRNAQNVEPRLMAANKVKASDVGTKTEEEGFTRDCVDGCWPVYTSSALTFQQPPYIRVIRGYENYVTWRITAGHAARECYRSCHIDV